MPEDLRALAVVIPAHNEQELVGRCLNSVRAAMDRFSTKNPDVILSCTVVLDDCSDHTAHVVNTYSQNDPRFRALPIKLQNVGAARDAGVRAALCGLPRNIAVEEIWIACTDADSEVPVTWLEEFARLRAAGADAVTGTVEPDRRQLDAERFASWKACYQQVEGHRHIHGANLGLSALAYLAVGGFAPLAAHEDVQLVADLRDAKFQLIASAELPVLTAGRLRGRLREGFADYLARLEPTRTPVR